MIKPRNDSCYYSSFKRNFQKLIDFYEILLDFDDFLSDNENIIFIIEEKRKVIISAVKLLIALQTTIENAAVIIETMEKLNLDKKFADLDTSLRSALIYVHPSKSAMELFLESKGTKISHFNTLVDKLLEMNTELETLLESPVWDEILLTEKRTFTCGTSSSKYSKTQTKSPNNLVKPKNLSVEEDLEEYVQLAMCFDLKDRELEKIVDHIMDPVMTIFRNGTFVKPKKVHPYSAIVGPSFMGKTQFSFILARIRPVFYFNFFLERDDPQNIYTCFDCYSAELMQILALDAESISKSVYLTELSESENIFHQNNLKLFTVGFIWSLIEHSMAFDFSKDDGGWFYHYLKERSATYEALSLNEFYDKMSKIFNIYFQ